MSHIFQAQIKDHSLSLKSDVGYNTNIKELKMKDLPKFLSTLKRTESNEIFFVKKNEDSFSIFKDTKFIATIDLILKNQLIEFISNTATLCSIKTK